MKFEYNCKGLTLWAFEKVKIQFGNFRGTKKKGLKNVMDNFSFEAYTDWIVIVTKELWFGKLSVAKLRGTPDEWLSLEMSAASTYYCYASK